MTRYTQIKQGGDRTFGGQFQGLKFAPRVYDTSSQETPKQHKIILDYAFFYLIMFGI